MSQSDSGAPDDAPNASGDALHVYSDALANAVATVAPSIVAIHARRRIPASGIVWRAGYVIAADHTIRRDRDITVTLNDGRQLAATLVGRDASTDLALLKLAEDIAPVAARWPDGAKLRTGQIVLAVGRPGTAITATLGTVHAVGSDWRTWQGGHMSELIRVDLSIHDGFSGSALIDVHGNVAGINSSILTRGAPATIPAATIDRVVDQLLVGGRVPRGWLGVGTQPVRLPERVRADANLSQEVGLLLVNVASNSPAEHAGLFVGDTLISLAGNATREADDVLSILGPDTVGRTLTARIARAGAVLEVPVVIGESPHAAHRGQAGGNSGGNTGSGGGATGGNPFGGNPFGGNPFGGHGFGGGGGSQRHAPHTEHFERLYARHARRHAAHAKTAAEAFEKFCEFSESFGLGFARSCGPRRPQ